LQLLEEAAATGCDAIKIQTYTPDTMTLNSNQPDFCIKGGLWNGRTLYDLYQEAHTPFEWHSQLFARAKELRVVLFSTPFDNTAVDLLESLDTPAYKIASFEVTDLALIRRVAETRKPMIISTGLANLEEISEAVETAKKFGCTEIVLLHCVSSYPAPDDSTNLRTIPDIQDRFGGVVGLSDHTRGIAVSVASIALGACVIEKHFTLKRSDGGPDAAFSLEPDEFKDLVQGCRSAWTSLGSASFEVNPVEEKNFVFRRSIYTVKPIAKGEQFTAENTKVIRPGYGLKPKFLPEVLGKQAASDIQVATALSWELIE
jgi:pseudaminic acid synthase